MQAADSSSCHSTHLSSPALGSRVNPPAVCSVLDVTLYTCASQLLLSKTELLDGPAEGLKSKTGHQANPGASSKYSGCTRYDSVGQAVGMNFYNTTQGSAQFEMYYLVLEFSG